MRAIARECLSRAEAAFADELDSLSEAELCLWREALGCLDDGPLGFVPLWEEAVLDPPDEAMTLAGVLCVRHCLTHRWLNPLEVGSARVEAATTLLERVVPLEGRLHRRLEELASENERFSVTALRYRTQRLLHPPPPSLLNSALEGEAACGPSEMSELVGRWEAERRARGLRRYLGDKLQQNLGFFRWGFSMPAYALRRRRVLRTLPASAGADATIAATFSAIEEVGPVVDNFVFLGQVTRLDAAPAALADFAFLFMQLADEVVDNCAKYLGPTELIELVEECYPRGERASSFTPLEGMDAAALDRAGIDPNIELEKYPLSIAAMLEVLHDLRGAMRDAIDALPLELRIRVRASTSGFFRHCFATFLDELYLAGLGVEGMDRLDPRDTAWHFHRKNNGVMTRWLELRALAHGLDPERHISRIREWGYVLSNFQVFDDLKDVFVDLGMQPNYALQVASTRFPSEYAWLRENAARLGPDISVMGVREVGLHAPQMVMHCMRISRLVALAQFGWLTVYVWDQRWQRSWTSIEGSFNRAEAERKSSLLTRSGRGGLGALFELFAATRELAETTHADDEYLAYILDMLAYDHRGLVYAALLPSPRALYRYHFLRMLLSPTEKAGMLRRLLRRHRGAAAEHLSSDAKQLAPALLRWLHAALDVPLEFSPPAPSERSA